MSPCCFTHMSGGCDATSMQQKQNSIVNRRVIVFDQAGLRDSKPLLSHCKIRRSVWACHASSRPIFFPSKALTTLHHVTIIFRVLSVTEPRSGHEVIAAPRDLQPPSSLFRLELPCLPLLFSKYAFWRWQVFSQAPPRTTSSSGLTLENVSTSNYTRMIK